MKQYLSKNDQSSKELQKVVSFSFGRSSARLCALMLGSADYVMMDTGAEDELTYDFGRKVNEKLNLNLTCLRGDFSKPLGKGVGYHIVGIDTLKQDLKPYKKMMEKYGVPYTGGMFCTDRMKLKPYQKYCNNKYGKGRYQTWIGIRFDEPSRLVGDNKDRNLSAYKSLIDDGLSGDEVSLLYVGMRKNINEIDQWVVSEKSKNLMIKRIKELEKSKIHYMAEISEETKEDVLLWWSRQDFDLQMPEWRGNCVFCPKKSNLKLAAAKNDCPEAYEDFIKAITSNEVRVDVKTGHHSKMYRGNQSLSGLIATFDGLTGEEIKARIRGSKHLDSGSCSESCEVFN